MESAKKVALSGKKDHPHVFHMLHDIHASVHQMQQTFVNELMLVFNHIYNALLNGHHDWNLVHLFRRGSFIKRILITELNENLAETGTEGFLCCCELPHGAAFSGLLDFGLGLL